jgi:hypothetical protein
MSLDILGDLDELEKARVTHTHTYQQHTHTHTTHAPDSFDVLADLDEFNKALQQQSQSTSIKPSTINNHQTINNHDNTALGCSDMPMK